MLPTLLVSASKQYFQSLSLRPVLLSHLHNFLEGILFFLLSPDPFLRDVVLESKLEK